MLAGFFLLRWKKMTFPKSLRCCFGLILNGVVLLAPPVASAFCTQNTNRKPEISQRLPGFITQQVVRVTPTSVKAGISGTLVISLTIKKSFHIYDPSPGDPFLTATRVIPLAVSGVAFGKPLWPVPTMVKGGKVHEGTVDITIPFTVKMGAKPGIAWFGASFYAQGCNSTTCFPPENFIVKVRKFLER